MRNRHAGAIVPFLIIPLFACSETVVVTEPGDPAVLQLFSGDLQRAVVGTTLPAQLVVELLDAAGRPVSGYTVGFATEGGTCSPTSAVTNGVGQARTTYTLGSTAGVQTVTASVSGLSAVAFSITADPGAPSRLSVVSGEGQQGPVATQLPQPVVVRVTDAHGNPIDGVPVMFTVAAGIVEPSAATTDDAGNASVAWTLGPTMGQQWLVARGITMADSASANAVPGPAADVTVALGDGQTGTRGAALPQDLVVGVTDAYGNRISGMTVTFVASDGGSIAPASVPTNANGYAIAVWTLGTPLGEQTATATVSSVGSAVATAVATVPMTLLDHVAVDAVYDGVNDRIVTVSANPSRLNLVDPATGAATSVDLDLAPSAVSVQPDGAYAAVGHNGFISYVDLSAGSVVKVYAVTADVIDLELPGNGWVYAFPRIDQWETIRSIELATGTESTTGTIRAGTLVRLHPSLDYIYGADNGLSPSDFEKYDIRGGVAAYMYDSPYHGDYAFSGNVWIYEDGSRLIARSGNVFSSSSVQAEDMLYVGNLAGASPIGAADHSTTLQRVVVTRAPYSWDPPAPELRSYTADYLAYQGSLGLPPYIVFGGAGSTAYRSEGQFVFVETSGARVYALLRVADDLAGPLPTGLAVFDAAEIP